MQNPFTFQTVVYTENMVTLDLYLKIQPYLFTLIKPCLSTFVLFD